MRGPDGAPGRLYAIDSARSSQPVVLYPSPSSGSEPDRQRFRDCPGPPDELGFSPHGLNAVRVKDGGTELYVVNHGGRESIEFFRVCAGWRGSARSGSAACPYRNMPLETVSRRFPEVGS